MEPRICVCVSARQRAWGQRGLLTSTSCLVRMLHICSGSIFCYSSVLLCFCRYRIRCNRLFWRARTLRMSNFAFQDRYSSSSKTEVNKNQLLGTTLCVSWRHSSQDWGVGVGVGVWKKTSHRHSALPSSSLCPCPALIYSCHRNRG